MDAATAIRKYFEQLGYDKTVADVYIALSTHGPQSVSGLSRAVNAERTRIYRILSQLEVIQMVEVEARYKRNLIKAAPITNLRILIARKKQEVADLQVQLEIIEQHASKNTVTSNGTKIQFYAGHSGLKQMLWNELRATGEIVGYAHRIFEEGVSKSLILTWTERFEQRGLRARLLTGDEWAASWKNAGTKGSGLRVRGMQYNYLPSKVFAINHARDIYDDVVAYFQWKDGEVFGFEVYNQEIADAERQIFETFWTKSAPDTRF